MVPSCAFGKLSEPAPDHGVDAALLSRENPMNRPLIVVAGTILALSSAATTQHTPSVEQDKAALVQAIHSFGMKLYDQVDKAAGNACLSPTSVSMALVMSLMGARGETAAEMTKVLGLNDHAVRTCRCHGGGPWEPDRLQRALRALMNDLDAPNDRSELHVVNDMWGQQGYGFLAEYAQRLSDSGASLREVDFANAPEAARQAINGYIAKQTKGRITGLLPPGSVTPIVRQVLTNAVYFKARWTSEFWSQATRPQPFTLQSGEKVTVPTMRQQDHFSYTQTKDLQILRMGYDRSRLEMVVLLPRRGLDLGVARRALEQDALTAWMKTTRYQEVVVSLPRFEFESSFALGEALQNMGMNCAFDVDRSDFTGINGGVEPLPISNVIHKTFLKIDEEGTEAAAATAELLCGSALPDNEPPAVFTADRPFLLVIRDPSSGLLLFVGQVVDPRASAG